MFGFGKLNSKTLCVKAELQYLAQPFWASMTWTRCPSSLSV